MVCLLVLGRKDIAAVAVKPALVPPLDPGGGREFDLFGRPPAPAANRQTIASGTTM